MLPYFLKPCWSLDLEFLVYKRPFVLKFSYYEVTRTITQRYHCCRPELDLLILPFFFLILGHFGGYMLFNTYNNHVQSNQTQYIQTPKMSPNVTYCLSFWYIMPMNHSNLAIYLTNSDQSARRKIWSITHQVHPSWTHQYLGVFSYKPFHVRYIVNVFKQRIRIYCCLIQKISNEVGRNDNFRALARKLSFLPTELDIFDIQQHYVCILFIVQRLICRVLLFLTPTNMNLAVYGNRLGVVMTS